MRSFRIPSSTEQCFQQLDSSELPGILQRYRQRLASCPTDPVSAAELQCVNNLLANVNMIDFRSGANSPLVRFLPGSTPKGRVAYLQILLAAVSDPDSTSFIKTAFLVEAELRTAVLYHDILAVSQQPQLVAAIAESGHTSVLQALMDLSRDTNVGGYCPTASQLVAKAKQSKCVLGNAELPKVSDAMLASLRNVKIGMLVFCDPALSGVISQCHQTKALLDGATALSHEDAWLGVIHDCVTEMGSARTLLATIDVPRFLSSALSIVESLAHRGIGTLKCDTSLRDRLTANPSDEQLAALDVELAALTGAPQAARSAVHAFMQALKASVETYLVASPVHRLLREYGVAESLESAHQYDVIQGSVLCRNGQEFEDSSLSVHIPRIVEQVLAPSCASTCGLPIRQASEWCIWCLQGREKGDPVPEFAKTLHADGALPEYRFAVNVQIRQLRVDSVDEKSGKKTNTTSDNAAEPATDVPQKFATRGELDAMLFDDRTGDVLFLLEMKQNLADLGKAHAQREKLFGLLDQAWAVAEKHVDPNTQPTTSQGEQAAAPPVELWFPGSVRRSTDMLRKYFSGPDRAHRWVFMTQVHVSDDTWKHIRSLPAAGDVRHVLEGCLAGCVGAAAQHAYARFMNDVLRQTRGMSPEARRAHVSELNRAAGSRTPSSDSHVLQQMLLGSLVCHDGETPSTPFRMPFITAKNTSSPATYMSAADVLAAHRVWANRDTSDMTVNAPLALAYPVFASFQYETNVATKSFFFYQKMCQKRSENAPNLASIVSELVNLGTLRSLLIISL